MAKKSSAPTKSDILAAISKDTGLTKKQVSAVFDSLNVVISPPRRPARVSTRSRARR